MQLISVNNNSICHLQKNSLPEIAVRKTSSNETYQSTTSLIGMKGSFFSDWKEDVVATLRGRLAAHFRPLS